MKTLNEKINEGLIVESAAKDLHKPRRGSTIYMMKKGETKSYKVVIDDVWVKKTHDPGFQDIYIRFEDNPLGIEVMTNIHFPGHKEFYEKPKLATIVSFENTGPVYLGVTKDAISDFIKSEGNNKLPYVMKQIGELQSKLEKLLQQKEELENDINIEITESLNKEE